MTASNIKRTGLLGYRPADPGLPVQVALKPSQEKLTFRVASNGTVSASLFLANASNSPRVAFKMKTTQPKRYLVKPNQGLLDAGEQREVSVMVAPARQAEVIEALERGDMEVDLSDRFQIVCAGVDDHFFDVVSKADARDQTEELQHMWEMVNKRDQLSWKLEVEFTWREDKHRSAGEKKAPPPSSSAAPQRPPEAQPKPTGSSTSASSDHKPASSSSGSHTRSQQAGHSVSLATLQAVSEETQKLRRKYDELVAFTVTLTGERDVLLNHLDSVKTQLKRELAVTRQLERGEAPTAARDPISQHRRRSSRTSQLTNLAAAWEGVTPDVQSAKEAKRRRQPSGYSLFAVAVVGLLAFFLGRFL